MGPGFLPLWYHYLLCLVSHSHPKPILPNTHINKQLLVQAFNTDIRGGGVETSSVSSVQLDAWQVNKWSFSRNDNITLYSYLSKTEDKQDMAGNVWCLFKTPGGNDNGEKQIKICRSSVCWSYGVHYQHNVLEHVMKAWAIWLNQNYHGTKKTRKYYDMAMR